MHSLRRRKQPTQGDDLETVEIIVLKRGWQALILIAEDLVLFWEAVVMTSMCNCCAGLILYCASVVLGLQ